MNLTKTINDALSVFNERQKATKRLPLTDLEGTMLGHILQTALAEQMGLLRDSMEIAASQAGIELQRDLDWATDIIISTILAENKLSVTVEDEKITRATAGFGLRVERGEGRTELEIVKVDSDGI